LSLCSAGPIIAILVLGLIFPAQGEYAPPLLSEFITSREFGLHFLAELPHQLKEVATGLFPVVIFFFVYQLFAGRVSKEQVPKLLVGVLYTYVGIVLFLTGASIGFLPVADTIGNMLATSSLKWLLVPIGMLLGYFIVLAEPAVHVLEKQVEEVTSGAIPKKMLSVAMSIAVAIAVGLAIFRALTGISVLWFVGIGYVLALGLSFVVPEVFTSIAFDSGGVASGAMTSTFLMPLSVGVTYAIGGNVMTDGFGMIAMVAMLPPITVQILGLIFRIKTARKSEYVVDFDNSVIDLDFPITVENDPMMIATEFPIFREDEPKTSEEYPDIIEFPIQ
jgi:hypothetical protein